MEQVLDFIKANKLIKPGEVVGVGVSGGVDSMALLHFLYENKQALDIDVVAIHINHSIRETSDADASFVLQKCRDMGIRVYKFTIDAPKISKEKNLSIETAARDGRYGVFEALVKKDIVDKVALAHHQSDQAETILMHILRGAGLAGARGMEPMRDKIYIRPLLTTSKSEIVKYAAENNIEYVEDETNYDTSYTRNYLRGVVMRDILKKWPNAVEAINNFAKTVAEDDEYIKSRIHMNSLIVDDKVVQMPCSYFYESGAIYSRIIFQALSLIGAKKDIERKHIEMIKELAISMENGKKVRLPNDVTVSKEYDFLTFENKYVEKPKLALPLRCETFEAENYGNVTIKRVNADKMNENDLYFDFRKVPKDAKWRYREEGDIFEKFGGGTKKLKSFLIDRKVPVRIRDFIPVLASGNEVYVIAGIAISEKVRVDADVKTCYTVKVEK